MVRKKINIIIFVVGCFITQQSFAIFPLNIFNPWDINIRPPEWRNKKTQLTGLIETGFKARGYNPNGDAVNVMQLWQPNQDALAMLQGFPSNSTETIFFEDTLMGPTDDGIRGHLSVTGKFDLKANGGFSWRYHLPYNMTIAAHLPFCAMSLKNITFTDLTQDVTEEDMLVKENLTDNFPQTLQQFDPTLDLSGWNRAGLGDLALFAHWLRSFPQNKPILKDVILTSRLGFIFPTSVRTNENQILSIPFGYNGSAGLWFGAGITLNWFNYIRGYIDFEFLHLFGNSRYQRIKTAPGQTDFLFLAKAHAHTDYGFTQQYNLCLEAYRIFHGLTFGVFYQFYRHGEDKLALYTNQYSNEIANTAEKLQEWTMHQFVFKVNYDFQCDLDDCAALKPNIFLFYKVPFNGKRALLVHTFGAVITLNF